MSVPTDSGRVVVREYPDHWLDETIAHEHAVLGYLEDVSFPSVRLVGRRDGGTLTRIDGRRLAVFHFAEGVNLSGSFISPRTGFESIRRCGALQARLHTLTADYRPGVSHHLGMEDDGEARFAGQLAVLDRLVDQGGAHPDVVWLREQAPAMRDRLCRLHDIAMDAGLGISLIHGDYGNHNVLFCRDGSATVHDFELARRDWRLVDIVETLANIPQMARAPFLAGYRAELGERPADWMLLGEMWEYHRLSGAVRSWESYATRKDPARLAVARRRVEHAVRLRETRVSEWM